MTNDDFFAALSAPQFKKVEVAAPAPIYIRAMTSGEHDEYETLIAGKDGKRQDWTNYRAKYLLFALADDKGARRFLSHADIPRIAGLPDAIMGPVYREARIFNGHARAEAEEKKSDSASEAVSGSDSPSAES
jgi:hypothetical protein